MDLSFLLVITPVFWILLVIASILLGAFYGWKRALYYGSINVLLFLCFVIINQVNPKVYDSFTILIFQKFVETIDYNVQAAILLRNLAEFILFVIFFLAINCFFLLLDLLFFKKYLRKYKFLIDPQTNKPSSKLKYKKYRLTKSFLGALIQTSLFLPTSFMTTSGFTSLVQPIVVLNQKTSGYSSEKENEAAEKRFQNNIDFALNRPNSAHSGFYNFLEYGWSDANITGDYANTSQKLIALKFLVQNKAKRTVDLFTDVFNNIKDAFKLSKDNLKEEGEAVKKTPEADKFIEKIKELVKQGDAPKEIKDKITIAGVDYVTANNPKLPKIVENLANLYQDKYSQIIFKSIEVNLNSYDMNDLKLLIQLFDKFKIEDQIQNLKKEIGKFGNDGIHVATSQIEQISNYDKNNLTIPKNKKLKLSFNAHISIVDYFVKKFDKVFNEEKTPKEFSLSNLRSLVNAVLSVFSEQAFKVETKE